MTHAVPPRVWVLLGRRAGDNRQLQALAAALPWRAEFKELAYQGSWPGWTPSYGRRPSLAPLTAASRALLTPPWPDLVLSVGWRSVPVALWIRQSCGARLVHLGRPRAPVSEFDLILTTPQYGLPAAANVIELKAPISDLEPRELAAAADAWRARIIDLPRPWIAVLVGGDATPFQLDAETASELGRRAAALARAQRGSLLIATSPRTSAAAATALLEAVNAPHHAFLWSKGGDNPYRAYLALADEIVVTGDSLSMALEAAATGKPLHLFELPKRGAWPLRLLEALDQFARRRAGLLRRIYFFLIRGGWLYAPRRPRAALQHLFDSGQAVTLGNGTPHSGPPNANSREQAVALVRKLLDAAPDGGALLVRE